MTRIPHTMRALRLAEYADDPKLEVASAPVPRPGVGEVLVQVDASPIHLDDVVFCRGQHGFRRALPTIPGVEGVGRVVQVGGGLVGRFLQGRRVAFAPREDVDGAWAEYAVVDAGRCLPVWDGLDDDAAATLLVDPVMALSLFDDLKSGRHRGVILTAPAGPIATMVRRLATAADVAVVAVVADAKEEGSLEAVGEGTTVVRLDAEDADARLRRAVRSADATALLDGVGGEATGRLLAAMPDGSAAILYGLAPGVRVGVDLSDLVYRGKTVRGVSFAERARQSGTQSLLAQLPRLRRHAADVLAVPVSDHVAMDDVPKLVARFDRRRPGAGRAVIRIARDDADAR